MTRRHVLAGLLLLALMPTALAAGEHDRSQTSTLPAARQIENLTLQYLSSKKPEQRKEIIQQLKALSGAKVTGNAGLPLNSAEDAVELNKAVSAMLPEVVSEAEAAELLEIAAEHPPVFSGRIDSLPKDVEFFVNARREAHSSRHIKGDVETLADVRVDHIGKDSLGRDGLTTAHVQQVWRINTAQGARSFSPHSVMFAAMSERLYIVQAHILRHDGSIAEATVSADEPVVERSSSMYFDSRTRDLRFPSLMPGDLVEVEYYLLPASEVNPWAGYYARLDLFRDSLPTRLRRRVVIAPSEMKLFAVEHGLAPASTKQHGADTIRTWQARDISAQPFEALSPGASATGPYLHISTIGSMQEFGRWYNSLLKPGLTMEPELRAIADQILARNLGTPQKVQAVYESVQRSTRYIAFEFGVHSYQPYPLATVERRGFGDCKDKAAMIVVLLRAVGVPAEFAMVRTRSAGEVEANAYSVQLFNHAVAYVPELNLYLDGTAEYAALGELPPDDQGAVAVTVDEDGNATRRIVPYSSPEANRVTREVRARLAPDGQVEFASQTKFAGYFAAEQRRNSQNADLAGSYRAALAQFYPSVKIAHAVAEGTARASREVDLKIEGSIDAAHGEREVTLRSSLNTAGLTKKYAPERVRRNPVLVPVTPSEHEIFDYDLPEGASATLPDDTHLETAFGKLEISYRRSGNKLQVETYTELNPLTVAPSDYAAFRAFCQAADEALRREVRIALP
jgi:transglutaminase-like putative cysteine protease